MGRRLAEISKETGAKIVYKSSYDKANRSSRESFRGPGLEEGLDILAEVKRVTGLPLLSDVHSPDQASAAATVGVVVVFLEVHYHQDHHLYDASTPRHLLKIKSRAIL